MRYLQSRAYRRIMTNSPAPEYSAERFDVAIIGGGAAGLSAAIALGRSLRRVIVIDAGRQRNLPAHDAHNILGREGIAPADLIAAGRSEAVGYGVTLADDAVSGARRDDAGFSLDLVSGAVVAARRILLATGLIDELPAIDGLSAGWGQTVLHCPYCHGWEVRGQRIGVIATGPMAEHQALLFGRLSDQVTVFDHGDVVGAEARARLGAMGIAVVGGLVERVLADGPRVQAVVVGGRDHAVDAVVVGTRMHARAEVFEQLGGEVTEHPLGSFIETDPTGRTALDGVWAAGNVRDLSAMVGAASGHGVFAGAAINADLVDADVREALASAVH